MEGLQPLQPAMPPWRNSLPSNNLIVIKHLWIYELVEGRMGCGAPGAGPRTIKRSNFHSQVYIMALLIC